MGMAEFFWTNEYTIGFLSLESYRQVTDFAKITFYLTAGLLILQG
jgi:hypothetical protein